MSDVIISTTSAIRYISLNRPEKRNALHSSLISRIGEELSVADSDENLRAIVIQGKGKDFCSGADLSELRKISDNSYEDNLEDARRLAELFTFIRKVKIPVIAAVHGRALAGGCGLATACDLIVAANTARFGYPEVKIGFLPAIVMALLRRNLSEKLAFELVTQGFEFSAERAFEIGLVNKLFDEDGFDEAVRSYASVYEKVSRSAVVLAKELLYRMDGLKFGPSMYAGAAVNAEARMTDDCKAGISRFLEK